MHDSVCVLQYYQADSEADARMTDKAGVAANQDFGRDKDAAVKALIKHKVHGVYVYQGIVSCSAIYFPSVDMYSYICDYLWLNGT